MKENSTNNKALLQSSHSHHETQSSSSKTFLQEDDGSKNIFLYGLHSSKNIIDSQCTSSRPTPHSNDQETALHGLPVGEMNVKEEEAASTAGASKALLHDDCGRERLKRHRVEVAGRVWIPDIWGQEELLKDWIDCSAFDAPLLPNRIMSARTALVEEGRRATSGRLRIENRC
ncbi:conserved hypothetical protein [Ricinus communis]|uniref:Protein BIC1 n=1 Tax=Ricinus communis TaxID=3988 RepID=B9SRX3_RICCO|nr:conserved hypothetical protein [Ricinus communis]|eukprot:XP_002528742.1 protein BIC1 [Ricinus communis]